MKSGIILVLAGYIVPVVLNLVTEAAGRKTSGTIYDFRMVPSNGISFIGMAGAVLPLVCIIWLIVDDQFKGFNVIWPISFLLLCIFAMLAPVKGFWDTTVKEDDITASRLWFIKEHAKISEISHCQAYRGGIHIFVTGVDKKVMSIDSMYTNLALFEERMAKEGITILPYCK